jgi:hypothetical protein
MEKNFEHGIYTLYNKLLNDDYAQKMYAALCNMRWQEEWDVSDYLLQNLDRIHRRFPIRERQIYSCSWRYAGGLVASVRCRNEDYMDYYCSGNEGVVDQEIKEDLDKLGWASLPWQF